MFSKFLISSSWSKFFTLSREKEEIYFSAATVVYLHYKQGNCSPLLEFSCQNKGSGIHLVLFPLIRDAVVFFSKTKTLQTQLNYKTTWAATNLV